MAQDGSEVLKKPGSFGTGYIYGRQTGIKGSKINMGCRTSGREWNKQSPSVTVKIKVGRHKQVEVD